MSKTKYTSDSIETLRFPQNVRSNPSMYIGGTDDHGLFVILREPADNAVDEFLAGRNTHVQIAIDSDGSYWVLDEGNGIPQGIKKTTINVNGKDVVSKKPTMQAVFDELHTSGKFKSEAYKVSIGTHGVGVKGTNATSEWLDAWTFFEGKWHSIGFKKGILTKAVGPGKPPKTPFGTPKRGTVIHYKPDPKVFSVKSFPPSMLVSWSEIQSYLNPGLRVSVSIKGKVKSWFSKEGPTAWVKKRLEDLKAESEPDLFLFSNELVTAAVAFSNADGFELKGYTNGLPNSQGGKHVNSVANALYEAIKPYMTGVKKVDGKAKLPFSANDFADGMLGIVNAKLHKPAFSSQDKAKLTDDRMGDEFQAVIFKAAEKFFKSNKAMAKRLAERASKISELKTKFKASKAVATALNKLKRGGLPPNYAPAARSVPIKDRELIIVEGDSAAGGVRKIREPHQALLPLTGKIFNAWKAKGDKALLSKAIMNILAAIGFDPKAEDPLRKLQVGRIIFMSDADPDGRHINCLLNALISRYMPGMYEMGIVYVADMPEFYSIAKGQLFVGETLSQVQTKLKKAGVKAEVKHAKGWGEVDAEILRILIASAARRLIQIEPLSSEDLRTFRSLMSKDEPEADKPDQETAPKKSKVKDEEAADEPKKGKSKAKPAAKTKPKKGK
jgi:DNA gyrase subunit B